MSTAQLSNQTLAQLHPATPLGGTPADSVQAAPRYAEQIAEIAGRLQRRFPSEQISQADLEGRVRSFYRQFDTARIRTFVAVFVERLVRSSIEQPRVRASGAAQPQG
jgi:hypothetical protein